jgi:hypothetical protein
VADAEADLGVSRVDLPGAREVTGDALDGGGGHVMFLSMIELSSTTGLTIAGNT